MHFWIIYSLFLVNVGISVHYDEDCESKWMELTLPSKIKVMFTQCLLHGYRYPLHKSRETQPQ